MQEVFEKIIKKLGLRAEKSEKKEMDAKYFEDAQVYKGERTAFRDAIEIVRQTAAEYNNGWIPCSERLPEPGKRYLVSCVWKDEDYKRPAVYDAVFGGDGLWHTHNYEPVSYEVIAWQPLPEPYNPKGE